MSTDNPGFVSSGAYNPLGLHTSSFHKKEVGSAGQRIQLAPLGASVSGKKYSFTTHIQDKVKCSFSMLPKGFISPWFSTSFINKIVGHKFLIQVNSM